MLKLTSDYPPPPRYFETNFNVPGGGYAEVGSCQLQRTGGILNGHGYSQSGSAYKQCCNAYSQSGSAYKQCCNAYSQSGSAYKQCCNAYSQSGSAHKQCCNAYLQSGSAHKQCENGLFAEHSQNFNLFQK